MPGLMLDEVVPGPDVGDRVARRQDELEYGFDRQGAVVLNT